MTDEELIKAVAQEVMEYYWHDGLQCWCDDKGAVSYPSWNPLTNANHRDLVVERMRELKWNIEIFSIRDFWRVRFLHYQIVEKDREADNINLGHAICEAALKAVENG